MVKLTESAIPDQMYFYYALLLLLWETLRFDHCFLFSYQTSTAWIMLVQ